MSRRSIRKTSSPLSYADDEKFDIAVEIEEITPRNGTTQSIRILPRKQITQSKTEKTANSVAEPTGTDIRDKKSSSKGKINSEQSRSNEEDATDAELTNSISPKKAKAKRKIEAEEQIEQESSEKKIKKEGKRKAEKDETIEEDAVTKKVKRKRKTKEEKEAETMPLAARTSIQTLKRPIYIGAHISAAGGKYPQWSFQYSSDITVLFYVYNPQSIVKQCHALFIYAFELSISLPCFTPCTHFDTG
jgi:hypothetical protein